MSTQLADRVTTGEVTGLWWYSHVFLGGGVVDWSPAALRVGSLVIRGLVVTDS